MLDPVLVTKSVSYEELLLQLLCLVKNWCGCVLCFRVVVNAWCFLHWRKKKLMSFFPKVFLL